MPVPTLSRDTPLVEIPDGVTLAHAIVDTVRDPLLVLDTRLRVMAGSRSFYETFHLSQGDVHGRLLYEIGGGQWNIPELRTLLESIARDQAIGDSRPISLKVEADAGTAISQHAVSIGLIVTESVMNALKHAFPDDDPNAAILVSYKVSDSDWR